MKLQYIENTIYKVNPVEYETIIIKLNITLQGVENANYCAKRFVVRRRFNLDFRPSVS